MGSSHLHHGQSFAAAIAIAVTVSGCSLKSERDTSRFDALYHASKAVQGAISVGVTYIEYGSLVRDMATEVLVAQDFAAAKDDSQLVREYAAALSAYRDGGTLWQSKIDNAKYDSIYHGRAALDSSTQPVVDRYGLKTIKEHSISSYKFESIAEGSMQVVWAAAALHAYAADSMYIQMARHRG